MGHPTQTRIMQNGSNWYWEVVTYDRDVIARGIAGSQAQARADAEEAASQARPLAQCWTARTTSISQDLATIAATCRREGTPCF
jgi:hypothetical protein